MNDRNPLVDDFIAFMVFIFIAAIALKFIG